MQCELTTVSLGKDAPLVSVVIPCLNEERTVGACIQAARASLTRLGIAGEVLVSDNGSTDRSVNMAREAGARVVHCPRLGYGHAVRFGVEQSRGQFVVMGDGDGSYDFASIDPFICRLQEGAHLVMGNRFQGGIQAGAMPWKNRYIGNPALTWLLNALFGTRIGDAHCGLRGFTRGAFDRMRLESAGMELASEMVVKAARIGLSVQEVPTVLWPDGRDRPPHLRPWRDGWRHLKLLLMFSPLHLFLLPAVVLLLAGLLLTVPLAAGPLRIGSARFDMHWMVLGVLLVLLGLQILYFGVAARCYTVWHRFPMPDRWLDILAPRVHLEHGLLIGGVLSFAGLAIDIWVLIDWVDVGFGALQRVRPALLATAMIAAGVQTVFFSFFMAIMKDKQH